MGDQEWKSSRSQVLALPGTELQAYGKNLECPKWDLKAGIMFVGRNMIFSDS